MFLKKKESTNTSTTRSARSTVLEPREAVFSYHANRSIRLASDKRNVDNSSSEVVPVRRSRQSVWHHASPIAILLLVLILVGLCTQLNDKVKIVLVGNASQQVAALYGDSSATYQQAADSYFNTFSAHNKLTINTGKIVSQLEKQFPEIDAASIELPLVGVQPVVYIQPVTPTLIAVANNDIYLLDSSGRVLTSITSAQESKLSSLKIPIINDQSNLNVSVGQIILPEATVAYITEVVGQLQAQNISISSMNLPAGEAELDVYMQGQGYYVKYNIYGNAREEVGTYLAVKAMLKTENKTPSQYVDVRVPNRAYYK